jgi:glycosyltransferase involved in cell wall biosynthesis
MNLLYHAAERLGSRMSTVTNVTPPETAAPTAGRSLAFVAPRHPDGSDWPWLSQIGPMRRHRFAATYIENTFTPLPKATGVAVRWRHMQAARRIRTAELAFLFSTDIGRGITRPPASLVRVPPLVYVGFTQDGPWSAAKVNDLSRALGRCAAVTVFSEDERRLYLDRYRLDVRRVHLIPIHTDETQQYRQYQGERPRSEPYVLSLGSPNRRFTPIARACKALGVPLVIITRPTHKLDSLDELASLGAEIITNADKPRSLNYLKHARFSVMGFDTPELPGAFTTLIHGMFLGTPSIVTSCLGMTDYVVDSVNGLVVAHGDEAALQRAIERMWNDPALVERFTHAGRERAGNLYSLEAAATRFDLLVEQVLGS